MSCGPRDCKPARTAVGKPLSIRTCCRGIAYDPMAKSQESRTD
ncbi:hypothetical protein I553_5307 [Mycobacterium xenopi 4042]|uniref:Uncharacterized protein n=1 Tax=Mycobacterium xenopi 4042 TaxID=1299334 RepID=X7ZXV1_MYCXE|nr:hypothetical protein I553_5307 [Mycobacterium xenopi 4042]